MALTSGFFNSLNKDRRYNSKQFSTLLGGIIKDGVFEAVPGIFATVPGEGLEVIVKPGLAWFDNTWTNNDGGLPLIISLPDVSLARYDAVVLETDVSDAVRNNTIKILTGTPAVNPAKPSLTNAGHIHQHPLAYIRVEPDTTSVPAQKIEIVVGTAACPFVTGVLQSATLEDLYGQWQAEFDKWFDNLKEQLGENVVANLQKQIDERLKIESKATDAEATAGVEDTKYVTAKGARLAAQFYEDPVGTVGYFLRAPANWALTNGEPFDAKVYPDLANIRPKTSTFVPTYGAVPVAGQSHDTKTLIMGNYHVSYYTRNGGLPTIVYAPDTDANDPAWRQQTLASSGEWQLGDALYTGGYYIFLGRKYVSSTGGPSEIYALWATNLAGPYQQTKVADITRYRDFEAFIGFTGGYFWVAANYTINNDGFGTYYTNNIATTFTYGALHGGNANDRRYIVGGKMILDGKAYIACSIISPSIGTNVPRLYTTSNGTSWSMINEPSLMLAGGNPHLKMCIYEPISKRYVGISNDGQRAWATSMTGTWTAFPNQKLGTPVALVTDSLGYIYYVFYATQSSGLTIYIYKTLNDFAMSITGYITTAGLEAGGPAQGTCRAFYPQITYVNMRPCFSYNGTSFRWQIAIPRGIRDGYGPRLPLLPSLGDGVNTYIKAKKSA